VATLVYGSVVCLEQLSFEEIIERKKLETENRPRTGKQSLLSYLIEASFDDTDELSMSSTS
jgi:hypothetical protein